MPLAFGADIKEGKVYRSKKRQPGDEEKRALNELQCLLNQRNRRSCGCEAQVHDLLENCLICGRLTCTAEGPGKCFSCGNLILSEDQRNRLAQYIDISQNGRPNQLSKSSAGSSSRTRIIDGQFDHFSIDSKRHLRDDERQRLRDNLDELQSKRNQRELVLEVDIDNLHAGLRSTAKIKDYESELRRLEINDRYEDDSVCTLAELITREYQNESPALQYIGPELLAKPKKLPVKSNDTVPKKKQGEKSQQPGSAQPGSAKPEQKQQKARQQPQAGQKQQQPKRDRSKKGPGKGKPPAPSAWTNKSNNNQQ